MSDAARLARLAYSKKPERMPYPKFEISQASLNEIKLHKSVAASDAAFSAAVSYIEALSGLYVGSTSWSIVKFYYSSYYSIKSLLLLDGVVPFNCGNEMLLDTSNGSFLKGGTSSHHWNWFSIRRTAAKEKWFTSQDSQETYQNLRAHRENVNYTHAFRDPELHPSLITAESDLAKKYRTYRDDSEFFYTYLPDHSMIAYPTRALVEVDERLKQESIAINSDKIDHLTSIWKLRDRCPLS